MSTNAGKAVYMTAGVLAAIYAAAILLIYYFEGNIGGLLYPAIVSGVLCVFLIYMIVINSEKTIKQPFSAMFVVGCYLILCLLICFPNQYVNDFAVMYLISIPIAVFFGLRYSVVAICAILVLTIVSGNCNWTLEIQHVMYLLISCVLANGKRKKGLDLVAAVIAFLLQGILLAVSVGIHSFGIKTLITEVFVIVINSAMIPIVFRLSQLYEQTGLVAETEAQVDVETAESERQAKQEVEEDLLHNPMVSVPVDYSKYPYELSYLIQDDCEVAMRLRGLAPRAYKRDLEIADFARRISYHFGANSDLVYAVALYHDIERIYHGEPSAQVILPECLYRMIKRQVEKQAPQSLEELIVLLSNHVLAIYRYIEKNNSDISISKVIDNIFNLQLKKGHIISAGISMSQYHKMRHEFTEEFLHYIESKEGKSV